MNVATAWVKAPKQIGGLDHLAVQAPCINIYGRLLPGITNVTDRARYYSFYPWLVWALEQSGYTTFDDRFIDAFRKADGLFTLISHQHAATSGDVHEHHAGATVGSANLAGYISKISAGETVVLADYAGRARESKPYFLNKLGGLGQYYLGVLAELSIMDGSSSGGVKYTRQFGLPLAEAMDSGVPRELFIQTVEEGEVSAQRLNELKAFCPCLLKDSTAELEMLRNLFFAQGMFQNGDAKPRYQTLGLILNLGDELAKRNKPLDTVHFRGCAYTGAMPDGETWLLSDDAARMRSLWGIYERNELLSISIQGLFYALLDAYEESRLALPNGAAIASWYVEESGELDQLNLLFPMNSDFRSLIKGSKKWLPQYEQWAADLHEVSLSERIVGLCRAGKSADNRVSIVDSALRVLMALAVRPETRSGYDSIIFPGNYLHAYPINLQSFLAAVANTWENMNVKQLLVWLFSNWGVEAHLRVALRKLRSQNQSTFRIRPSDSGLQVIDSPQAVHTTPRFNQAVRILKDLDLLIDDGSVTRCTDVGKRYKEAPSDG